MQVIRIFIAVMMVCGLTGCKDADNGYDTTGVFETTDVVVSAKGSGEIVRFDVSEGQTVQAGTSLGVIDTTQMYLKKAQLEAGMRAVAHRRVTVARQMASLEEQIAAQRREQQRFDTLVKQGAANRKQLDDITSALVALEKQLSAQTETLNNSNLSLSDEEAALAVQIAQIDDQIRNAIIQSPIDGVIMGKYAEAGELAVEGKALFRVADVREMYLRAYLTSSQLTQVRIGQSATVYADWGKSGRREYEGKVVWISDKAEFTPKTIQTRDERAHLVYAVKIRVQNDGYIKQGMYGECRLLE